MKRLRDRLALVFGGLMFCLLVAIIVNEESVLTRLVEDMETQRFYASAGDFQSRLDGLMDVHAARLEELDRDGDLESLALSQVPQATAEMLALARRTGAERVVLVDATGRILAASPDDAVAGKLAAMAPAVGQTRKALVLLPEGLHLISTRTFVQKGRASLALVVADRVGVDLLRRAAGGEDDVLFLTAGDSVLEVYVPTQVGTQASRLLEEAFEAYLRRSTHDSDAWGLRLGQENFVLVNRQLVPATTDSPSVNLWFGRLAREIYAPVQGQRQRVIALGAAGILAVLTAAFALSGRITRPLETLNRRLRKVTQGELAPIQIPGRDEVSQLAASFNEMTTWLRQRQLLRRYVPVQARHLIDADVEGRVVLGGQRTQISVLFSDLRDFTSLSEQLDAAEVVAILNEYLEAMIGILHAHGGDVSDYLGDAILAVFHEDLEPSGLRAVRAALRMQEALEGLSTSSTNPHVRQLRMGIGIHTGEAVEGNIGSAERLKHAVVGDTVNLGARIQDRSRDGRHTCVLVSQATHRQLGDQVETVFFGNERLKGKTEPVPVWEVIREVSPPAPAEEAISTAQAPDSEVPPSGPGEPGLEAPPSGPGD